MPARKYFPLGLAYGIAFCNRVKETQWLVSNSLNAKHSLLIAPRRYGKSSLAEKAIQKTKLPFIKINFHLCTTEEEVQQLIIAQVIKLIGKSLGNMEKIISSIKKYVANLSPRLVFDSGPVTLELTPKSQVNQAVLISEALLLIERLLQEKNQKAILFFDEFQEISKISKGANIEGAIRTAAQEMQNLSIIFSGSIRSLLLRMFEDEKRPLYKLCRKLKLARISAKDYQKHLNKIAKKTWRQELTKSTFQEIMNLSNRHPYYVNYLCDILWEENSKPPNSKAVQKAWAMVVEEERSDIFCEISQLSLNQRKILKFIVKNQVNNLFSQQTCRLLNLPASTIASALEALIERDYIEADAKAGHKIINPLLSTVLIEGN